MASLKKQMSDVLLRELGHASLVKDFAKTYQNLGVDVSSEDTIVYLGSNNELLASMISLYQFGLTRKLNNIINNIKDNK